jgi:hypothetical protein
MVGALTVFAIFQQYLARQSMVVVQRAHLSGLAVLQGESAIEELVDQFASRANDPSTELFEALRELMRSPWSQLDVAPFLSMPEITIQPQSGFIGASAGNPDSLTSEITEFHARLRAPRYAAADRGTEEFTAILTLSVIARAAKPRGEMKRRVSATYEVRGLLTSPPRPFDQSGLFVQNAGAVVDLGSVDSEKDQLIQDYESFRQRLESVAGSQGEAGPRLTQLSEGMASQEEMSAALPAHGPLSTGALAGPRHGAVITAASLDLAGDLVRRRNQRTQLLSEFESALGQPDAVGPAAYKVISSLRGARAEFDRFHAQYALIDASSEGYQSGLAPYFDRLQPDFYRQRVHLRLAADSPLFTRWAAGEAQLNGVVGLEPGGQEVHIVGQPKGQVVLVTEGQHVVFDGPPPGAEDAAVEEAAIPDRIIVASIGGDVTVAGDVKASVFLVAGDGATGGRLRIRAGTTLYGVVAIGEGSSGQLALEGHISYDGSLRFPTPVAGEDEDDDHSGHGHRRGPSQDPYTIVLSPAPIF